MTDLPDLRAIQIYVNQDGWLLLPRWNSFL